MDSAKANKQQSALPLCPLIGDGGIFANRLLSYADELCEKDILFLGGWFDYTIPIEDHALPLYRSLKKRGAHDVEICMFDTDHSFENVKDELRSKIISWLKK